MEVHNQVIDRVVQVEERTELQEEKIRWQPPDQRLGRGGENVNPFVLAAGLLLAGVCVALAALG